MVHVQKPGAYWGLFYFAVLLLIFGALVFGWFLVFDFIGHVIG